jgi:hypothetical protein
MSLLCVRSRWPGPAFFWLPQLQHVRMRVALVVCLPTRRSERAAAAKESKDQKDQ